MWLDKTATRKPNDPTVIVVTSKEFWATMAKTPTSDRVVMEDCRPGVRRETELGPVVLTLAPAVWEKQKKVLKAKRGYDLILPPAQTKLCLFCSAPMKVTRELEQISIMKCPHCQATEMWGKQVVGGTLGAGEKEKLPSGKREV